MLESLGINRRSSLLKGPYVTISRPFREGASVAAEGVFHSRLRERISRRTTLSGTHGPRYRQRAHHAGATGTGSGKMECLLTPCGVDGLHLAFHLCACSRRTEYR